MKRSLAALIARGVDTKTAEHLVNDGYTLAKLQEMTERGLKDSGLTQVQREALRAGSRPPIPEATTIRTLYASRWRCCVCRLEKPAILHHIKPWHESHDHSPENLAVLCLDHHG